MKKVLKSLVMLITVFSLVLSTGGSTYAVQGPDLPNGVVSPMGVGVISVTASRTTSTSAKITASGAVTILADSITTTATLYEYNSATGTLTSSGVAPVSKTIYNCASYSFQTTFPLQASKLYKVKLAIKDVSGGQTNSTTTYSKFF
jgi:hypothetical protein